MASRLVSLGRALGSLGVSACAATGDDAPPEPQPGPPRIVAVEKPAATVVELHFSEPVTPVGDVDPSSFRLSYATVFGTGPQASTRYEDPMSYLCGSTDLCLEDADVVAIEPGSNDAVARLTIAAWSPVFCEQMAFAAMMFPAHLLLHYRGEDSIIEDLDGESLAPVGPTWVDEEDYYLLSPGELPEMASLLPIPCPT
jgi:hypothetical protein